MRPVDTYCNAVSYYRPQRSCRKVMYSQVCVKNSVHGGGWGCLPQCMLGYIHSPISGQTPPLGRHPLGRHPPGQTATAADGMHPTGMHSCY